MKTVKIRVIIGLTLLLIGGGLLWKLDSLATQRDSAREDAERWERSADALSKVLQQEREEALMAEGVMDRYRKRIADLQERETVVIKEVIEYVSDPSISVCDISPIWVRIYNTSGGAMSEAPTSVAGTDGSPGGVYTDKSILETVTKNNSNCEREKEKLRGLQEFIRQLYSSRGETYID